jgi:methionine-rich copper-binding protein CopC
MSRVVSLVLMVCVVMVATPALAHTELDYTEPSADVEVGEPVSEIVVAFTLPVTLVGNGFEVLDPQGEIQQPTVETGDDTVFRLIMAEPLVSGEVGVRYEVIAEDGHVLAEGFSFTVTAQASTTTLPPATTAAQTDSSIVETTIPAGTTIVAATTTTEATDGSGSAVPWLIGVGLVVVAVAGLIAGSRSRSSR